jgi:regulatory protein
MSTSESQPAGSDARRTTRSGSRRRRRFGPDRPTTPEDPALDGAIDPESAARTILLNKLTGQARTRAELADTLAERGIADDVAHRVLDRFGEVGLIDDAAFAAAWVETRHAGRGLARRALAHELRRRGVDDELVRDAVDELDPDREAATARQLVRRKLRTMRPADGPDGRQAAMRRLLGMLARKGYPAGMAMTVIREEFRDWGADAADPAEVTTDESVPDDEFLAPGD